MMSKLNDPEIFKRRRLAAVVRDEVARTPGDPWGAARRAWARLADDRATLAVLTVAAELRGRGPAFPDPGDAA